MYTSEEHRDREMVVRQSHKTLEPLRGNRGTQGPQLTVVRKKQVRVQASVLVAQLVPLRLFHGLTSHQPQTRFSLLEEAVAPPSRADVGQRNGRQTTDDRLIGGTTGRTVGGATRINLLVKAAGKTGCVVPGEAN